MWNVVNAINVLPMCNGSTRAGNPPPLEELEEAVFSIGRRALSFVFFKNPCEMTFVGKPKFESNFVDPHIGMPEPRFDQFEPVMSDIMLKTFTQMTFEILADI